MLKLASWLGAALVLLGATMPLSGGQVTYPALGNFETHEGTIEIWLTPTADLYPPLDQGSYAAPMRLFQLTVPGEFHFAVGWNAKKGRRGNVYGVYASLNHLGPMRDAMFSIPTRLLEGWEPGQRHHVALTWRGRQMALYADGVLIGQRNQSIGFTGLLAGCKLIIGHADGQDAGYILHAVRVSCTELDAARLQSAQPVAMLDTLLLDRFDRLPHPPADATQPDVIAGLLGETSGTIKGTHHWIDSPRPGLSLDKPSPDRPASSSSR